MTFVRFLVCLLIWLGAADAGATVHVFKHAGTVQNATADTTTTGGWASAEMYARPGFEDTNYEGGRINNALSASVPYDSPNPNWRSNSLLSVDLSALPADKTITSANLYLRLVLASGSGDHTIAVRRLLVAFNSSQATWNDRVTSTAWNTGGALGSGADVASGNIDTTAVAVTIDTWHSFDLTSWVQGVYAGTFTNHGLLLIRDEASASDGAERKFASPGYLAESNMEPELVVVYEDASSSVIPIFQHHQLQRMQ